MKVCCMLVFANIGNIYHWSIRKPATTIRDAGTGGGQEGQLPLLPFARRGKGGRSALWVVKYYLINHISMSDAFWAKSWGVILNVTWLRAFAFIGKSTHYCRFISSPGSIQVPLWCAFAPPPPLCLFIVPASLTTIFHYFIFYQAKGGFPVLARSSSQLAASACMSTFIQSQC
jgi:hypothetical protein